MSFLYRIIRLTLLVFFKLFSGLEVIRSGNIPEKGGVIVATNHVSYLDPLIVGCAIKKRQPTYLARHGLFKIPVIGAFVRTFSFPVERDNPKPSTIKEAVKRLKKGELIVMFPEGGRSNDGALLEAKRGIGMIAALARPIIIPAFIDGTYKALPVGAKFIRPARIRVFLGKPIKIREEGAGKDFQERIGRDIMDALRKLKAKAEGKA